MSQPNVFLLPAAHEADRFASALHALIRHEPAVGRVMVAWLADMSTASGEGSDNGASPRFERAELHVHHDPADRPDLSLLCEGVEILCAHKLVLEHLESQLERYLGRSGEGGREARLAVIARDPVDLPQTVTDAPDFLAPRPRTLQDGEPREHAENEHHCWSGLYQALEADAETSASSLVRDFLAYMDTLGMHPWRMGRWEDLFTHSASASLMYGTWAEVKSALSDVASTFTRDSNGLGMLIKRPRPWMRALYVVIEREAGVTVSGIDLAQPVLTARAWVGRSRPEAKALRAQEAGTIQGEMGLIAHAPAREVAEWDPFLTLAREWHEPLEDVVVGDRDATVARLAGFVRRVLEHATEAVEGEVEGLGTS